MCHVALPRASFGLLQVVSTSWSPQKAAKKKKPSGAKKVAKKASQKKSLLKKTSQKKSLSQFV